MMASKVFEKIKNFGSWMVENPKEVFIASAIVFASLYFNTVIEG